MLALYYYTIKFDICLLEVLHPTWHPPLPPTPNVLSEILPNIHCTWIFIISLFKCESNGMVPYEVVSCKEIWSTNATPENSISKGCKSLQFLQQRYLWSMPKYLSFVWSRRWSKCQFLLFWSILDSFIQKLLVLIWPKWYKSNWIGYWQT